MSSSRRSRWRSSLGSSGGSSELAGVGGSRGSVLLGHRLGVLDRAAGALGGEELLDLGAWDGAAQVVALRHVAAELAEAVPGGDRVDALGDDLQPEVVTEIDRGADDH